MLRRLSTEERGTGIVEFAIGATVLFTLIVMILQGALLFQGWLAVTNATREGARAGAPCFQRSVSPCTTAQVTGWTQAAAAGVAAGQLSAVGVTVVDTADGKMLRVTMSYTMPVIAPMVGTFFPKGLTLTADSAMRLENQ